MPFYRAHHVASPCCYGKGLEKVFPVVILKNCPTQKQKRKEEYEEFVLSNLLEVCQKYVNIH